MTLGKTIVAIMITLALAVILSALFVFTLRPTFGSTITGNDYQATTTGSGVASSTKLWMLKTGSGALGSVVVTMPSTATGYPAMKMYDATSTTHATTSARLLGSMSTSTQTQGTYQFDVEFTSGLGIEMPSGFDGSFTVTYR